MPHIHHSSSHVPSETPSRRSLREYKTPAYLSYFICGDVHLTDDSTPCFLSLISPNVLSFSALSSSNRQLVNSVSHIQEPNSFSQVVTHPGWQEAMAKELDALLANETWEVVSLLPRRKA